MLGRISTVTITAPDLPAAVAAYQRYLGYRVVDDGALGREMARAWGRPQMAGQRAVLLEPESGAETYLRFVQGPAYVEHEPLSCVGWNAAELIVEDVDALADELANSPFRIIGRPADLSFSDQIRAMQVVGPAREVLYLTQIRQKLAAFDTPVAATRYRLRITKTRFTTAVMLGVIRLLRADGVDAAGLPPSYPLDGRGEEIPHETTQLTGIDDAMVADASPIESVAAAITWPKWAPAWAVGAAGQPTARAGTPRRLAVGSSTQMSTLGAPSGGRGGSGQAGEDSSVVRPMTPVNGVPSL